MLLVSQEVVWVVVAVVVDVVVAMVVAAVESSSFFSALPVLFVKPGSWIPGGMQTPRCSSFLKPQKARRGPLDLSMARKRRQRRTPWFEASLWKEGCFEARRWPLDLSMARKRRFGKTRQACRIPARGGKGLPADLCKLVPALPGAVAEQLCSRIL